MSEYEIYGLCDQGTQLSSNEDHILLGRFIKNRGSLGLNIQSDDDIIQAYGLLFAVADGIGGISGGGREASQQALSILEQRFYASPKARVAKENLFDASKQANQALLEILARRPDWSHMGCTLSGICLLAQGFYLFHCGDSRVYRFRHGLLTPLTRDDTITETALSRGKLSLQQAAQEAEQYRLTNFLGNPYFSCHIEYKKNLHPGDIILIASDGFYKPVGDEQIELCINEHKGSLKQLAEQFKQLLLASGGQDNYSFILLQNKNAQF